MMKAYKETDASLSHFLNFGCFTLASVLAKRNTTKISYTAHFKLNLLRDLYTY